VGSFIPPNKLRKLKDIAHNSHTTELSHQYHVDVPISVADVWLGAPWSSYASCTSDFQNVYSETYSYYCGYFALDITNNYSQINKWKN
jgi:Tfp pilus tip-associated adhesin PilY1